MRIETIEKTIKVKDYIEEYVDVAGFLEKCQECENYTNKWSCPTFDFDPLEYWNQYDSFRVIGKKMFLDENDKNNWEACMAKTKEELTEELFIEEGKNPGSIALSAGSCHLCGKDDCMKKTGEPCKYPERMRYSIEALGGNVGLTASQLLEIPLLWITDGKVPDYFALVGGLLYRDVTDSI